MRVATAPWASGVQAAKVAIIGLLCLAPDGVQAGTFEVQAVDAGRTLEGGLSRVRQTLAASIDAQPQRRAAQAPQPPASVPAAVEAPRPASIDNAGVAAALKVVGAGLRTSTHGDGDVDTWLHHFVVRRDMANAAAWTMRETAAGLPDRPFAAQLDELADDLLAAPQAGYGTAGYWAGMAGRQDALFAGVAERIDRLSDATPRTRDDDYDRGLVAGLSEAAAMLASRTPGYGDITYWIRHHTIRRDTGNAVASALRVLADAAEHRLFAAQLREIAEDLEAAPQGGYGNVADCARLVRDQDWALGRASERLSRLRDALDEERTRR